MESTITVGSADTLASFWLPESLPPVQPGDLVEFSETGFHIAGRCLEGPDDGGWYLVESLAELHHVGGYDDTPATIHVGDQRRVHWGRGLVGLALEVDAEHGRVLRAARPVPVPPPVERVVTIQPSQPKPASTEATARRSRAGNTIRKQTGRGTWAAINLGADGQRFQRQQLTTKLHPQARAALEQLAADAGLRVCEVLEALVLSPGAVAAVGRARPLGVRPAEAAATPAADRTGERRTRLTKGQAERVDQVLLELLERGRTGKADLERVAAAIAADGLPAQGVSTLRTRLTRLARRQGQGQ
jgi:hypothetical protein